MGLRVISDSCWVGDDMEVEGFASSWSWSWSLSGFIMSVGFSSLMLVVVRVRNGFDLREDFECFFDVDHFWLLVKDDSEIGLVDSS